MKKIEKFIDTASLWKVYLMGIPVLSIFVFLTYMIMTCVPDLREIFTMLVIAKISVAFSFVFSLLITLIISMARKSKKFWDKAKIVEALIESCNNKSEMQSMYSTDFAELRTLAMGQPHSAELHKLDAIIRTKYKYIN